MSEERITVINEQATESYPNLFSPLQLGPVTLRNRIVHASMTTRFPKDSRVTEKLVDYHVTRARGGAAMIITEPMNVLEQHRDPMRVNVFSGENKASIADWAKRVRDAGSHLIGQFQDPGRGRHKAGRFRLAIGPSALPDDMSWTVPHVPTTAELEGIIGEFAFSARQLQQAGFAGVEVSAGHGHLFHQFMAARSNRRTDRFGGDVAGRVRLVAEILRAVRTECGADFIIGIKLPGEDGMAGGIGLAESAGITEEIAKTQCVDYLSYCWGAHSNTLDWHLPDLHGERTPYVEKIAQLAKSAPGVVVGALGLITDPNEGERILCDGKADLIMLGRSLVTDPAWGVKSAAGREADIRYCVSCNSCWGAITTGSVLTCDNNPRVGQSDELDWQPETTTKHRNVVVVGAGVAGLEAAWVAAARGYQVTVFTTGDEVGGKTRLHSELPGGEHLSSIYDYQKLQCERHSVSFVVGPPAQLHNITELQPDAVVLATGSTPNWPAYLPIDYQDASFFPDIRTVARNMLGRTQSIAGTAVIYDSDHEAFTYAAAELLKSRFAHVVIVTPRESIALEQAVVNRLGINRRIYGAGIEVLTWSEPVWSDEIENGSLCVQHSLSGETRLIDNVSLITHATARTPNDELAAPLRELGVEIHLIGDCYAPRTVMVATQDGHQLGNAL